MGVLQDTCLLSGCKDLPTHTGASKRHFHHPILTFLALFFPDLGPWRGQQWHRDPEGQEQHPCGSMTGKKRGCGWSSVCVEEFSWELQAGLNFKQLDKPLEIDNYKKRAFLGCYPQHSWGAGAITVRGVSCNKLNQTAWTN